MAFIKISMDSHEDTTACYKLQMLKSVVYNHYSSLLAGISVSNLKAWQVGISLCRARLPCTSSFEAKHQVRGGSVMITVVLWHFEVKVLCL